MKIKVIKPEPEFKPFTIEIVVETPEEKYTLRELGNNSIGMAQELDSRSRGISEQVANDVFSKFYEVLK